MAVAMAEAITIAMMVAIAAAMTKGQRPT